MNELKSQVQNLNELNEIIKKQDRKIKELENKQISTADKILDSCDTDLEVKSDCKAENCKGKVEETAESRLKKNILDYFKDFNEKISIELLEQFKEFSLFNQQVKKRDESSKLDFLKSYIKQSDNQLSQQILQSFSTQLSNLVSSSIEDSLYICKQVDQIIICLRDQEQIEKVIYQETDEKLMKFMKANANVQVSL
ncbi:hypothetical protein OXYTRIMIC_607 [Oxytricha trifallax]|uniref:Uncharacterized protein n=1 Tax=Oxytricha trifallax TaxID=1172189 RepID=A0A073I0B5_9SPIT|nr:hypothetical protein OXYTRIMIC_607 [Oxytricha trifallax]